MTTPHKAMLIQAHDALQVATTPLAKDRQEVLRAIAALQAAIDAPEPEPVAWIGDSPTKGNGRRLFWTRSEAYRYASNITPLYAAAGAAPVPEGWQLVPLEPTPEMLAAWDTAQGSTQEGKPVWKLSVDRQAYYTYKAILAAAPKDPT